MDSLIPIRRLFPAHTRTVFLVLGTVLGSIVTAATQEPPVRTGHPRPQGATHEVHAVYQMGGQTVGSYEERSDTTSTGEIKTVINTDLIFNRLGSKLEMKSSSQYDESSDAQLKFAAGDVSSSEQNTHIEASVIGTSLQIKTTTGGKSYERTVALSGTLLGPEGARRLVLSRCHGLGDTVSYDAFFPEFGSAATITDVVVGMEDVSTDEGTKTGLKLAQTTSMIPGKVTLWLDRDGRLLRQILPSPLGDIEAIRSNAPLKTRVEGATLPEETFTQSIIKANVRLPEERFVDSVRLKIIHRKPELGWPNLEAENQRVIERNGDSVILEVNRLQPKAVQTLPAAPDAALAPYLSPNALLQSDDSNIQAIAKSVVGNERDAWKAARALQQWTNDHMQFDPGIAIAPASEVARNRRGTCFGYSMLLGALTRAAGIPSRLRMGYVYAGGIWGGHAWIDVRIGNDWIPLDGALYTPGSADAARFSFFTSALDEGTLTGLGSFAQLLTHADIKILEYTVGGRRIDVPEGAAPFVIEKDTYRNPWVGLSITKPSSFQFTDSDLAWPETTVVAMRGTEGQTVEVANLSASVPTEESDAERLLQSYGITGRRFTMRMAEKKGVAASSAQKAGVVLIDQGNVWMIRATGTGAKKLLKLVLSTVQLAY